MKFFKSILMVLFIASIVNFTPNQTVSADDGKIWAERTILAYIEKKQLGIYPNTDKYNIFLKGVLLGDVPELTKIPSVFVTNDTEAQYIMEYAAQNYRSQEDMSLSKIAEEPSFEAMPSTQEKLSSINSLSQTGSSSSIAYAYSWAANGGYSRNPSYPDFGIDDCTNFISQAIHAGGLSQAGSGDGCKYEDTTTEWHVQYNSSPSWTCTGGNRNWEWSTSWSVAYQFRVYLAYNNGFAVDRGYTYSAITAKSILAPGDIVQMQKLSNGAWTTFHTMLVTKEDASGLYVTYHSGGTDGLMDYVNRPLSNISTNSTTHRFLLLQLTYPNFTFTDVPPYHWAWNNIERLYNSGVTGGCATNPLKYCPTGYVTRAQMAVFLLKGIHGSSYSPPNPTGIFSDVPTSHWAARWIEQLYREGITGGCALSPLSYCPEDSTTHAQMAVFLLRSKYDRYYWPPSASGSLYSDVPSNHWAANWIEQATQDSIFDTSELNNDGCSFGSFCPETPVTRALMAGLLIRTFNLP